MEAAVRMKSVKLWLGKMPTFILMPEATKQSAAQSDGVVVVQVVEPHSEAIMECSAALIPPCIVESAEGICMPKIPSARAVPSKIVIKDFMRGV